MSLSRIANNTLRRRIDVFDKIRGSHDGKRGSRLKGFHGGPSVAHTVFIRRFGEHGPYCTVPWFPIFLQKRGKYIVAKPVAGMFVGSMLGKTDAFFVVQPVDLVGVIGVFGVHIPAKDHSSVVVVFFHFSV
jgi:hypothetical protein